MKVVNCISRISLLDRNWIVCLKKKALFLLVILFSDFLTPKRGETSGFKKKKKKKKKKNNSLEKYFFLGK